MKIERDTWHARRFHRWRSSLPARHRWSLEQNNVRAVSLCPYFWIVMVFAPIARMLDWVADLTEVPDKDWRAALEFCFFIAMVIWCVGLCVGLVVALVVNLVVDWWATLKTLGLILAGVVGFVVGVGSLVLWSEKRREKKQRKSDGKPKAPPLVKEWASAKHRRVCPLIEFEDAS